MALRLLLHIIISNRIFVFACVQILRAFRCLRRLGLRAGAVSLGDVSVDEDCHVAVATRMAAAAATLAEADGNAIGADGDGRTPAGSVSPGPPWSRLMSEDARRLANSLTEAMREGLRRNGGSHQVLTNLLGQSSQESSPPSFFF